MANRRTGLSVERGMLVGQPAPSKLLSKQTFSVFWPVWSKIAMRNIWLYPPKEGLYH